MIPWAAPCNPDDKILRQSHGLRDWEPRATLPFMRPTHGNNCLSFLFYFIAINPQAAGRGAEVIRRNHLMIVRGPLTRQK
jgi:hypothetical protein